MFAYYSNVILLCSNSDQAHIWQFAFTEFLILVVVSFIAAARDGVFMSKIGDPRIAEEGCGVFLFLCPNCQYAG